MSPKTTLALMIVTLVVGSAAIYSHFYEKENREEQELSEKKVFHFKDKKLSFLKILYSDKLIELKCKQKEGCAFDGTGDWKITSPIEFAGDSSSIGSLASSILNLQLNDKIAFEEQVSSEEFGFGISTMEIGLVGEEKTITLNLGDHSPVTSDIYAHTSVAPKTVYLVPAYIQEQLKKDLFHWQSKKVFSQLNLDDIQKFKWKGKTIISFEKKQGNWMLSFPHKVKANIDVIDGLLNGLELLEAKKIQDNQASAFKKKKPDLALTLSKESGDINISFYKVAKSGELFAVTSESKSLFSIEKTFIDRFEKKIDEYRNRKLVSTKDFSELEKATFRFPKDKESISFLFKNSKWQVETEAKEKIALERVENIINQLIESDIKNFISLPSSKFSSLSSPDFVLEGYSSKEKLFAREFFVYKQKELISKGELPSEIVTFTEAFSRVYPVRLTDLYQKSNKTVVHSSELEEQKEESTHHGHHH